MAIAVVIPVYKHSSLVLDALASLVDQPSFAAHHVVVVDDGCPHEQTFFGLAGLADVHSNVTYIRQENGGLSAARNKGVNYVLAALPGVEAVFFLDADNRLSSYSLDRFTAALAASDADWFYPDIEMFGIPWSGDFSGRYRPYVHAFQNICEAGSLVRRRVFESGLRFDEEMKHGYEDWDFWLCALERGFRGAHLPVSGFEYRKRAESMLSQSARFDDAIKRFMDDKHGWMRDAGALVTLEHRDTPRYAVIDADDGTVRLFSDPAAAPATMPFRDYTDLLASSFARPSGFASGCIVVMMPQAVAARCAELKLAHWLFQDLEQRLLGHEVAAMRFEPGDDATVRIAQSQGRGGAAVHAVAVTLDTLRHLLDRNDDATARRLFGTPDAATTSLRTVTIPAPVPGAIKDQWRSFVDLWSAERARLYPSLWSGRRRLHPGAPDVSETPLAARRKFDGAPLPNKARPRARTWALAVPAWTGDAAILALAQDLARRGYAIDLHIVGNTAMRGATTPFESVFLLDSELLNKQSVQHYRGTPLPQTATQPAAFLTNLLSAYEVVVTVGAADVLASFAALRGRGVVTVNARGDDVALAFEHVTDLFAASSPERIEVLGMHGIPAAKLCATDTLADAAEKIVRQRDLRRAWPHLADRPPSRS